MIFSILVFISTHFAQALPAADCKAEPSGSNEVKVTIGAKQISIIGWAHLDDKDIDVLREGFNNAVQSADKNECFMAKNALSAALTKQSHDLKSAQAVFKKLEATHATKPLAYIGLEASPSELATNYTALRSINDGLQMMQLRCGLMIAPETSSFAIMLPGPEYAFNGAYQGMVVLKALEDEAAKENNIRQMASKSSIKTLMSGVRLRNQAMVKNAIAQDGNGAIVVGAVHVADMASEFVRQCKAL